MAVDLRYAEVKCAGEGCGKEYTCTPTTDYFHTAEQEKEGVEKTAENGFCWDCFMKVTGMSSQPEPPYV
jgi:hypothetical protein